MRSPRRIPRYNGFAEYLVADSGDHRRAIGFAEGKELCEALVGLTNHSSANVRFQGLLTCSRLDKKQSIEVGRPVDVVMEGKGTLWIKDVELLEGPLPKQ